MKCPNCGSNDFDGFDCDKCGYDIDVDYGDQYFN